MTDLRPDSLDRGPTPLDMRRLLHDHWKGYALQGGLMAAVGAVALLAPLVATLASTLLFGWLMLFLGGLGIAGAFRLRGSSGFGSTLAAAVLALLVGAVIVLDPFAGAVTLTTALAVYLLLTGLATGWLASAFRASTGRFWLLALSALVNVALALLLVLGLPGTAVWAVGTFLGISLLVSGLSLLFAALDARNAPTRAGRR